MASRKQQRRRRAVTTAAQVEAVQRAIKQERNHRALELIAELTPNATGERALVLRKYEGLAHARLGSVARARQIFEDLLTRAKGALKVDVCGIYARTWMDLYDRQGERGLLLRSRDLYAEAFRLSGRKDTYTGINAAAKSVFLGDLEAALQKVPRSQRDYWHEATVAEVLLIRQRYAEAAERYAAAVDRDPTDHGSHGSTWLQARRLMRALGTSPDDQAMVWNAFRHLTDADPWASVTQPPFRRLRAYAFDPSLARSLSTSVMNQVTLEVPWEPDRQKANGKVVPQPEAGPIGEYLEVVDYDPASGCYYEEVDLNDRNLLATDGLAPAEGNPKFHQQMVYAVAMNVISHFERALGRRALWAPRITHGRDGEDQAEFVRRLRIYPHALREANAYYSPHRKALLFGYFPAESGDPRLIPGSTVFTCLSHDVIAHEVSHALLDGLHPRFAEPSNIDVLAFHEAFADIVALFQHFSHPKVLRYEIARSRGDLAAGTMLGQLAQEFGRAIGRYGALRDAIGETDRKTGEWRPKEPEPDALEKAHEPHERGAILVSAVFDAFLAIYRSRISDLLRIATQGSGILEPGALHPDLVDRLAGEASKTATHLLHICIRALDYCPPVDMTFGDYLRAMITADVDVVPDDRYNYRLAMIEAFQRHGIYPHDVKNLSVDSLVWRQPRAGRIDLEMLFRDDPHSGSDGGDGRTIRPEWRPTADRRELFDGMRANAAAVRHWLTHHCSAAAADELGLMLSADAPGGFERQGRVPAVEVHSVRVARRSRPDGQVLTNLVVEILQRRRGYLSPADQDRVDRGRSTTSEGDFDFRGGCTLLIDPEDCRVRYAITKHILSAGRLAGQRAFHGGHEPSLRATYFGDPGRAARTREPFALLHRPI